MGFGGGSSMPAPSKPTPRKVEPLLDRARAKRDILGRQRRSLATRPLGEPNIKNVTLGA
jgi:hypothetical protein